MKIEFTGLMISDLAREYYRLLGVEKDREQARKNLLGLRPHTIKLDVLEEAMKALHKKQIAELKALKGDQKQLIKEMQEKKFIENLNK